MKTCPNYKQQIYIGLNIKPPLQIFSKHQIQSNYDFTYFQKITLSMINLETCKKFIKDFISHPIYYTSIISDFQQLNNPFLPIKKILTTKRITKCKKCIIIIYLFISGWEAKSSMKRFLKLISQYEYSLLKYAELW